MTDPLAKGHRRQASDREFHELKLRDAREALHKELEKLIKTAKPERQEEFRKQFDAFENLFGHFLVESGSSVEWDKVKPLPAGAVKAYDELTAEENKDHIREMLNKLVVIKLNGGLGTSMGCTGPKSLISVRNELTFLDLNVQQIEIYNKTVSMVSFTFDTVVAVGAASLYDVPTVVSTFISLNKTYGANVPLVLMSSFNTVEDTEKIVKRYTQVQVKIHMFQQSMYPRINRETLHPIARQVYDHEHDGKHKSSLSEQSWYPPGHGDIYRSFYDSGLLQKFIDEGKEYVFISNIDNLGATVDISILNFLMNQKNEGKVPEFIMEVTDKTRADIKGGTLVNYADKLRLLEIAQVPKLHVDEFKSVSKFKIFNTNNLWVNMPAIKRIIDDNTLHMEVIVNPKTLDNGLNVIQLEQAVGAAIKSFEGAIGINVPRRRFLPVKMTSDLLIVMSNLYSLRQGTLIMNPERSFHNVPLVKLGDDFKKVKEFLARFASIPDILDLDHLTVAGDVTFGRNVVLKGTVIIIANHGERIDIPPGAILENKIVSGNLRIMDH